MPRSKFLIDMLASEANELLDSRELARILTGDPFLALRALRHAESGRSRTLGRETTTPLASVLQIGIDGVFRLIQGCPLCDDLRPGLSHCEFTATTGAYLARQWSSHRADLSPDEVALAALLSDIGEMMLWHFAPELPEKIEAALSSGNLLRPVQLQQQLLGFSFKSLSLMLAEAWKLPGLLTLLIKGVDNVRANVARLANQTAKHIQINPESPFLSSDIINVHELIPVDVAKLIEPLPVSDDYKAYILQSISKEHP